MCGVICCFIICHDVRYPELVRLPAAAGAQVGFFCRCESGVAHERKLSAYRAMPISRATENGIFVVMTNAPADADDLHRSGSSHGESKVIHPDGNVMVEAGMFSEEILIEDLALSAASRNIAQRALNDVTCLSGWLKEGLKRVTMPQSKPNRSQNIS